MSSYNGEQYIDEQIESILLQKGCKVKLLVRDDGSTDSTKEILEKYHRSGKLDWYTGENLRSAKSFINLIINCPKEYDYYAFSDQDDVWDFDKLYTAVQLLDKNKKKPTIYCSNALLVDENLNSLDQYVYKHKPEFTLERILISGEIQGATMVMNKHLVKYLDQTEMPEYVPMHDYYISVLCCALGGEIIYDENSHMCYRQHSHNVLGVSTSVSSRIKRNIKRVIKQNSFLDLEKFSYLFLLKNKDKLTNHAVDVLSLASEYKKNFLSRVQLAFLPNLNFGRWNQNITYKIAIILGNL